uniref:Zinc finger GRF-type domain-containing protein n=1 Tax=Hordeum vulgare subsp. vulgare TaxID=112509 RepID=A0A8I6XVU6_HORVV
MSLTSSSSSDVRRRALALPLIRCAGCKEKVRMFVSTTEKHDGWVFYKCQNHGVSCEFWRWELEYVQYLVENHYLVGDAAVDAIGAAEERREQLLNAQELHYMNGSTSMSKKFVKRESGNVMTRQQAAALMKLGREPVMLMKILLVVVLMLGVGALVLYMVKN